MASRNSERIISINKLMKDRNDLRKTFMFTDLFQAVLS